MKLVVLGGGGVRTPLLVRGLLARQRHLHVDELVLMDRDEGALGLMQLIVDEACAAAGWPFPVRYTIDAAEAITGATFVLTTLRVGGIEARIVDERIALQRGVVGQETTGAGGFAYALRSIPVLLDYADLVRRLAPEAWLINFSNPAGLITEALVRYGGVRAVGICDTPPGTLRALCRWLGVTADTVVPHYLGLNHLGWFQGLWSNGQDLLPSLVDRAEELVTLEELSMFDPELIRTLGAVPTEYLYFYYYQDRVLANLHSTGQTRGQVILDQNQRFFSALRKARSNRARSYWTLYYDYLRERQGTYMRAEAGAGGLADVHPEQEGYEGVALGLIESMVAGANRLLIANVPNRGAISGLGPDDVVEVPCTVTAAGPLPMAMGPLPSHAAGLVHQVKAYERLTVEAAVEGSRAKAVTALMTNPLVRSYPVATALVDDYLTAHAQHLPRFHGVGKKGRSA